MNRRDHLRWVGMIGASAVAGCSLLREESEGSASEFIPQSSDYLSVAVGNLNLVALAIRNLQESSDPRTVTFEEGEPRERLDKADSAIQNAEDQSESANQQDIDAVRTYAAVLEATIQTVIDLLAASQHLEETKEMLGETELEVDTARDAISQAKNTSASAVTARETATSRINRADSDRLGALDAEFAAVRTGVETLSGYVAGVDGLSRGYDTYLAGVADAQQADTEIDTESFETAKDAFASAVASFQDAETVFMNTLAETPDTVNTELETGQRRSAVLRFVSAGNITLLNGRATLKTVESAFEDDMREDEALEDARHSLDDGTNAASDARDQFNEASAVQIDEFTEQIERGTSRAGALESLARGYLSLIDAIDTLQDGESTLLDDDPAAANETFQTATEQSTIAKERFNQGATEVDLFASEFNQASSRANAVESLAGGYADLASGVVDLRTGRDNLEQSAFDTAISHFQTASDRFGDATQSFETEASETLDEFDSEFGRAQCRTEHFNAAVDHLDTAAEAGKDRDRSQFQTEQEQAEQELDNVDNC